MKQFVPPMLQLDGSGVVHGVYSSVPQTQQGVMLALPQSLLEV
jgi:hypothetical protein